MIDDEREDAEEALQEAKEAKIRSDSKHTPVRNERTQSSFLDKTTRSTTYANSTSVGFSSSGLETGEHAIGDASTAAILADKIDEAVGTGKLGQDKLTVAELQLLEDISRGSVVRSLVLPTYSRDNYRILL